MALEKLKLSLGQKVGCTAEIVTQSGTSVSASGLSFSTRLAVNRLGHCRATRSSCLGFVQNGRLAFSKALKKSSNFLYGLSLPAISAEGTPGSGRLLLWRLSHCPCFDIRLDDGLLDKINGRVGTKGKRNEPTELSLDSAQTSKLCFNTKTTETSHWLAVALEPEERSLRGGTCLKQRIDAF